MLHPAEELASQFPLHPSPLVKYIRLGLANGALPLTSGQPYLDAMDVEAMAECAMKGILSHPKGLLYGSNRGLGALREAVLHWQKTEGCAPEEAGEEHLMLTLGSQYAFDLICQGTVKPNDPVALDAPCYPDTWCTLIRHKARLMPIPVDQDGMDLDVLEERCTRGDIPKLVYTILNHQNPSGCSMSPERQARLLKMADRYRFLIVADDPYRLLNLDGPRDHGASIPLVGFQSGLVLYLGSFSKVLAPGLRLGWILGHPAMVESLARLQEMTMISMPAADSLLVLEFLKQGLMAEQLQRVRRFLKVRRDALKEGLARWKLNVRVPSGGCFINLFVDQPSAMAMELVTHRGVATVPERAFWPHVPEAKDRFLRLSFSWCSPEELQRAADIIGELASEGVRG
ncbi:transcriptional regulator with HTH domain and aminotransferase domain [Thermanaerovibrio velox DSM 12556]|uniref:Transcriptional regulator with HTH domain and aminotransferase domain n=1 Tax=Thermanaerovibrio velox DSM 12556 TaxID=926567 RepID=H0UND4_9BACT|nr:PLP-dependent aminotransferase family protein [Thermanaerovibrio velox]EHM09341.1 transcriptional regulator with HTH domain and aminotransferase domain [Thermanaerovibrio velox DSM 12556]